MRNADLPASPQPLRTPVSLTRRLDLVLWQCFGQGGWLAGRRRLAHVTTLLLSLGR
ncbi:MAG: hypothetical protein IT340_15835 [Chloroflexi bacterium]|nr:hypothetical protein [Chloroflexota bacterium]